MNNPFYRALTSEFDTYAARLEAWQEFRQQRQLSTEERCIILRTQSERLLRWFYDPEPSDLGWVASSQRLQEAGLRDAAINWGDLHVVDIQAFAEGGYHIIIEEANAPELEVWMAGQLAAWGWTVIVKTEW